jgi:hypothetical protein
MESRELESHEEKPLPGWVCLGIGVLFIALLAAGLLAVRMLS